MPNFANDKEAIEALREAYLKLKNEIHKVIIGQEEVIEQVLNAVFSRGHCLLVGVPGLAKTLLVNTISETLGLEYKRIQFTPDLMPSDIIGSEILDKNKEFRFIKGPLFANIILADEINRTPPKTQSALLEAMQEKRITVAGKRYKLDDPFFVLATQNPIEQEGTYPLPEAQLDRFMFNVYLDYPTYEDEVNIVKSTTVGNHEKPEKVLSIKEILFFQELLEKVPVPDDVFNYAVNLVSMTRRNTEKAHDWANKYLEWGAGPRASQFLIIGAKTNAVLNGKFAPDIEDVKAVALIVLRHRIVVNYKADAEGISEDQIIEKLIGIKS